MQNSSKPTVVMIELSYLNVKGKPVWSYWIKVNDIIIHHDYIDNKYELKDILKRHAVWKRTKYQELKSSFTI